MPSYYRKVDIRRGLNTYPEKPLRVSSGVEGPKSGKEPGTSASNYKKGECFRGRTCSLVFTGGGKAYTKKEKVS